MNCEPCGKYFSGMVPYQQHLDSEKHKKKIAMLSYTSGKSPELPSWGNGIATGLSNSIHCPACNIYFPSISTFQSHSMSLEHANKVAKQNAKESESPGAQSVSSTTLNPDVKEDTILPTTEIPQSSVISFAECKVCDKQFSGSEPYRQHLVSVAHQKKVEMSNNLPGQKQGPLFTCEECQKTCSGPIPYNQHLVSDVHRKKLKQLELLKMFEEVKGTKTTMMEVDGTIINRTSVTNSLANPQSWFCTDCMVQCSGPAPYEQHIKGEAHAKVLRRKVLFKAGPDSKNEIKDEVASDKTQDAPGSSGVTFASPMLHIGVISTVENDTILPEALSDLSVIKPKDMDVTEFMPNDKIDFDKNLAESTEKDGADNRDYTENGASKMKVNGTTPSSANLVTLVGDEENRVSCTEAIAEYETCELCDVKLRTKEETLKHFESIEHFRKKYPQQFMEK